MLALIVTQLLHRRFWALALALLGGVATSSARAQDSTLTRLIQQHQWPLTQLKGQFAGPGWEQLRAAIGQSQFVLVGENHGLAQIPGFTAAVAQELKPTVFAAEIDAYLAQDLTALGAQPGPPTAYLRQYPEALSFYSWAEEFDLVRMLRAQHVQLWGLDQVFGATAARFYARLAEQVQGTAVRTYLRQRAATYQVQGLAFERRGHDEWSMSAQSPRALDSLLALTQSEGPDIRQMVQDYASSYAIYRTYTAHAGLPSGFSSHQERLNLMRHNLLRYLAPYLTVGGPPLPKILFKFGANHLARGLSPATFGEFYDIGNLAQDLVEAQGQKSLHLMVVGKQGTQARGANQLNPRKNVATYTAAPDATLKSFFEQTSGPAWNLVDLRPARRALTTGQLQVSSSAMQRILLGYDYLVIIPETTASQTYEFSYKRP